MVLSGFEGKFTIKVSDHKKGDLDTIHHIIEKKHNCSDQYTIVIESRRDLIFFLRKLKDVDLENLTGNSFGEITI